MPDDRDNDRDNDKRWNEILGQAAGSPTLERLLRKQRQREKAAAAEKKRRARARQAEVIRELVEEVITGIVRKIRKLRGTPAVIGKQDVLAYLARQLASKGGKAGGSKGGKARMEALTAEQRSELARKAAAARWGR